MRVTIAIPVHNGERFLGAALASALSQSLPANEILVVDDASTDQSAEICHSSCWSGRIRYEYNAQPSGFVDAWNRVAKKSGGDFVAILHQDDVLDAGYVSSMADIHRRFPNARHLFCAAAYINETGEPLSSPAGSLPEEPFSWSGRDYASAYLNGVVKNQHIHRCPGVMSERRLLVEECPYRKEAGLIADDDFFYRVGTFTDVAGTGRPLAKYRLHECSVSARTDLTVALARDYLFQVRGLSAEGAGSFSDEDKAKLHGLAVRFINQALYESLLRGDRNQAQLSLEQGGELDALVPNCMKGNLPNWARPMWRLADGRAGWPFSLAAAYAKAIHAVGAVRHVGRNARAAAHGAKLG